MLRMHDGKAGPPCPPATPEVARLRVAEGVARASLVGANTLCECRRLQHLHYFRVAQSVPNR